MTVSRTRTPSKPLLPKHHVPIHNCQVLEQGRSACHQHLYNLCVCANIMGAKRHTAHATPLLYYRSISFSIVTVWHHPAVRSFSCCCSEQLCCRRWSKVPHFHDPPGAKRDELTSSDLSISTSTPIAVTVIANGDSVSRLDHHWFVPEHLRTNLPWSLHWKSGTNHLSNIILKHLKVLKLRMLSMCIDHISDPRLIGHSAPERLCGTTTCRWRLQHISTSECEQTSCQKQSKWETWLEKQHIQQSGKSMASVIVDIFGRTSPQQADWSDISSQSAAQKHQGNLILQILAASWGCHVVTIFNEVHADGWQCMVSQGILCTSRQVSCVSCMKLLQRM